MLNMAAESKQVPEGSDNEILLSLNSNFEFCFSHQVYKDFMLFPQTTY